MNLIVEETGQICFWDHILCFGKTNSS